MCELVRALIAGGVIEGVKLSDLNENAFDTIDCPGEGEEGKYININVVLGQSEICAVSGGSAAQNYAWYILLGGISITVNELPKWDLNPRSKERLDVKLLAK